MKRYLITYTNNSTEDYGGVVRIEYLSNWILIEFKDGNILRINNAQVLSVLTYEE